MSNHCSNLLPVRGDKRKLVVPEIDFHDPPETRYTTYVWLYQW